MGLAVRTVAVLAARAVAPLVQKTLHRKARQERKGLEWGGSDFGIFHSEPGRAFMGPGGLEVQVELLGWCGSSASALESGEFREKLLGAISVEALSGFFASL
ncbi:MAG: hypothetical protein ACP5M4_11685 [Acidobacteriaceae bacterium]